MEQEEKKGSGATWKDNIEDVELDEPVNKPIKKLKKIKMPQQ